MENGGKQYMKRYKYIAAVLSISVWSALCTACGSSAAQGTGTAEAKTAESDTAVTDDASAGSAATGAGAKTTIDTSDIFSNRDLSGEYDAAACESITLSDTGIATSAKGVAADGSTVTITEGGDYILDGSLSDGMIIIDVDKTEKVQLVLNNVEINSATSAAIYIRQADKVFVTLAEGSKNSLSNGGEFAAIDDNNIDAVIFSKEDLALNGAGSLTVTSPAGHGVVSKDGLVVTNGTYKITAASHGLAGKDSVAVADGIFEIEAGKDAVHSANDDDSTKGCVYIKDGTFRFSVESDGISAVNEVLVAGGNIVIGKSYEGIEARIINITGGEIDITSGDDGLNATDKRNNETEETQSAGSSAADKRNTETETQSAGADAADKRNAGMHRAAGDNGMDGGAFKRGGGMMDTQEEAMVNISGGTIHINAEGDGIDSNGYLTVSGGEVYVSGPSNNGNGALDYGISASISGGTVIAVGFSGMAQNFGETSTQCAMLVNSQDQQAAGTKIVLTDTAGKELVAWTAEKSYNSVVISCPELTVGSTYTVKTGGSTTEVAFEDVIYGEGFGFGGGMHGGFGKDGEQPLGMPEPENSEPPKGAG